MPAALGVNTRRTLLLRVCGHKQHPSPAYITGAHHQLTSERFHIITPTTDRLNEHQVTILHVQAMLIDMCTYTFTLHTPHTLHTLAHLDDHLEADLSRGGHDFC